MDFAERLKTSPAILSAGAITTRLVYEFGLSTPDGATFIHLFHSEGRSALTEIYRSYMNVAAEHNLPMLLFTPTPRAHPDMLVRHGFNDPDDLWRVNAEAVAFVQALRRETGVEDLIFISGAVGPRLDGYDPRGAPDAATAELYHRPQIEVLANAGIDLLTAGIFPSLEELLGVSRALAATALPYILAPVLNPSGQLRDGTPLCEAVARIDTSAGRPALQFIAGCTHPTHFAEAAASPAWPTSERVAGLMGNASSLTPEERDRLDYIDGAKPEEFADLIVELHDRGMKILGGCCGTSDAHLHALARRLNSEIDRPHG